MFISILCLFLSGPSPCNLFTQRGHPEITHFARAVQQIPNASCPPPPLDSGSCAFFLFFFLAVMIMKCAPSQWQSCACVCGWWLNSCELRLLYIFLHEFKLFYIMFEMEISWPRIRFFFPLHLWSNCPINWHQIVVIKFWCVVLSVQEVHRV